MKHKLVIGLILIAVLGLAFFVIPQAEALIGTIIVITALAFVAGVTIGSYINAWWQSQSQIGVTLDSYVNTTAVNTENLLRATQQEYINEQFMMQSSRYYMMRKAEYASQYYLNYSNFPEVEVIALSGLGNEYQTFWTTGIEQLNQFENLLDQTTDSIFSGDLNDYTIYAQIGDSRTAKIARYDLKQRDIDVWFGAYDEFDPTRYDYEGTQPESGYIGATSFNSNVTLKGMPNNFNESYISVYTTDAISGTPTFKIAVYDNEGTELKGQTTPTWTSYNTTSGYFKVGYVSLGNLITEDNQIKLWFNKTNDSNDLKLESWFLTYKTNDLISSVYRRDCHNIPILTVDYVDKFKLPIQKLAFANKNGTIIRNVDFQLFQNSFRVWYDTLYQTLGLAMNAGEAYWLYLKGLGYDDIGDITIPLPLPDLLIPPIELTEDMTTEEFFSLMVAYYSSLADLFQNPSFYKNVQNVTLSNIDFISYPVWITGTLNIAGVNYTVIEAWLCPETTSLTINLGNNTVTQNIQTSFSHYNATDYKILVYKLMHAGDWFFVDHIYKRDKAGKISELTSVTLNIMNMERYILYWTDTPLPDTTDPVITPYLAGILSTLIIVLVITNAVSGMFNKKRKKS